MSQEHRDRIADTAGRLVGLVDRDGNALVGAGRSIAFGLDAEAPRLPRHVPERPQHRRYATGGKRGRAWYKGSATAKRATRRGGNPARSGLAGPVEVHTPRKQPRKRPAIRWGAWL